MRVTWDPRKAQVNQRAHGVTFEEAAECFADPRAMIATDPARPTRFLLIGQSRTHRRLLAVHAKRDADRLRILSARKALSPELRKYELARSRAAPASPLASVRKLLAIGVTKAHVHRAPHTAIAASPKTTTAPAPAPTHIASPASSPKNTSEGGASRVRDYSRSYASRVLPKLLQLKASRGRPKKGEEIGPTPARSLRLPIAMWTALQGVARDHNITVHALLRLAVAHFLETRSNLASGPAPSEHPIRPGGQTKQPRQPRRRWRKFKTRSTGTG